MEQIGVGTVHVRYDFAATDLVSVELADGSLINRRFELILEREDGREITTGKRKRHLHAVLCHPALPDPSNDTSVRRRTREGAYAAVLEDANASSATSAQAASSSRPPSGVTAPKAVTPVIASA